MNAMSDTYIASVFTTGARNDIAWLHVRLLGAVRAGRMTVVGLVPGHVEEWNQVDLKDVALTFGQSPAMVDGSLEEAELAWERFQTLFLRMWDVDIELFHAPSGLGLRVSFVASDRPPANLVRRLSALVPDLTLSVVFAHTQGADAGFGVCAQGRWLAGEQLLPERWTLNELEDPPPARVPDHAMAGRGPGS